jgi:hypothetical protein
VTAKFRRISALALVLSVTAIAAPSASARPIDDPALGPQTYGAQTSIQTSPPAQVRVLHVSPSPGFDWGDAGLGALAAFALTMIGLGAAVVLSHRRSDAHGPATT